MLPSGGVGPLGWVEAIPLLPVGQRRGQEAS